MCPCLTYYRDGLLTVRKSTQLINLAIVSGCSSTIYQEILEEPQQFLLMTWNGKVTKLLILFLILLRVSFRVVWLH